MCPLADAGRSAPRPRTFLIRAALVLAAVPVAELVARIVTEHDTERARAAIVEGGEWMRTGLGRPGEAPDAGGLRLHPYYGFEDGNARQDFATSPRYFARPEASEAFDVLVLGGSVAAGLGLEGGPRLDAELSERLGGRTVRIFGHGRGGFKQPQQLMLLAYLFTIGFEPDAVVNLDGFNEVALALANARRGAHPLHPALSHWGRLLTTNEPDGEAFELLVDVRAEVGRAAELAAAALERGFHHSALLTRATLWRLGGVRARGLARYDEFLARISASDHYSADLGPRFDGDRDAVLREAVAGWARASRSMHDLCTGRGIVYLHVLQPTLHDAGSKPLTAEERASSAGPPEWIEGVVHGYPLLRAAAGDLRAQGVAFLDASRLFAELEQTTYRDVCHFDRVGYGLLSTAVAAELAAGVRRP